MKFPRLDDEYRAELDRINGRRSWTKYIIAGSVVLIIAGLAVIVSDQ